MTIIEEEAKEMPNETLTVQAILFGPTKEKFQSYKRKTGKKNQDIINDCINGFLKDE